MAAVKARTKPAAVDPYLVNGTRIEVGLPVCLRLYPCLGETPPDVKELANHVSKWGSRFLLLNEIHRHQGSFVLDATVTEAVQLVMQTRIPGIRIGDTKYTILVLSPDESVKWLLELETLSDLSEPSNIPMACNDTSITPGSTVHVVLKRESSPGPAGPLYTPEEYRDSAVRWLQKSCTIQDVRILKEGHLSLLITTEVKNSTQFYTSLEPGKVKLKRDAVFLADILSPEDAELWMQIRDVSSDSDDEMEIPISQRSSVDEFASSDDSTALVNQPKKPPSPARKATKKAYKKRVRERKRSHRDSSPDCAPSTSAGASLQLPKRSALEPTNHSPSPASSAIQTAEQTPTPVSEPPAEAPSTQTLEVQAPSTLTTLPVAAPTVTPSSNQATRKKKARWATVDFSKVAVEVPPPAAVTTLLVRPVDPTHSLRQLNPNQLIPALHSNLGEVCGIRDIRAGGLAVDLLPASVKDTALATTVIHTTKVTVSRPMASPTCAVITGVHPELTEGEILQAVSSAVPVTAVKRLAKPGLQSWAVKLSFQGSTVPEKVLLFGRTHATKAYKDRPLRCHKCQRFGHPARVCRSKGRCLICSGDHLSDSCPQPDQPVCCNCGEAHPADSTACPVRAFQEKVIAVKQANNLPFKTARVAVKKAAQTYAAALRGPKADSPEVLSPRPTPTNESNKAAASQTTAQPEVPHTGPADSFSRKDLLDLFKRINDALVEAKLTNDILTALEKVSTLFKDLLTS